MSSGQSAISFLAVMTVTAHDRRLMGDYPGRKQVRTRAKRAVKNDRIIAKNAEAKKLAAKK
jgi:hypothetical protein